MYRREERTMPEVTRCCSLAASFAAHHSFVAHLRAMKRTPSVIRKPKRLASDANQTPRPNHLAPEMRGHGRGGRGRLDMFPVNSQLAHELSSFVRGLSLSRCRKPLILSKVSTNRSLPPSSAKQALPARGRSDHQMGRHPGVAYFCSSRVHLRARLDWASS